MKDKLCIATFVNTEFGMHTAKPPVSGARPLHPNVLHPNWQQTSSKEIVVDSNFSRPPLSACSVNLQKQQTRSQQSNYYTVAARILVCWCQLVEANHYPSTVSRFSCWGVDSLPAPRPGPPAQFRAHG